MYNRFTKNKMHSNSINIMILLMSILIFSTINIILLGYEKFSYEIDKKKKNKQILTLFIL